MFFGNNPEYRTARDVVEIRNIKANLVSVNVERLVREGYLERHSVAGDRRKMELLCTETVSYTHLDVYKRQALYSRGD